MDTTSKTKTVLLIEDERSLNRAAVFKLEQAGHKVISTTNAEDALKILKENKDIHIVWLDLLLPGMDGIDFLKELQKYPELKEKKVVICSVSGSGDTKKLALELGAVAYFVKSDYDLKELVEKIMSYAQD